MWIFLTKYEKRDKFSTERQDSHLKNEGKIGIDIGDVIIDGVKNERTDTSFLGDQYLQTTAVPGAFETIKALVDSQFGNRVYLISQCSEKVEMRIRRWLDYHDFHNLTGVSHGRVWLCRTPAEKIRLCGEIGITHFVDDKLEVLSYLVNIVPNRYLFRSKPREIAKFPRFLPQVTQVQSWEEIAKLLVT